MTFHGMKNPTSSIKKWKSCQPSKLRQTLRQSLSDHWSKFLTKNKNLHSARTRKGAGFFCSVSLTKTQNLTRPQTLTRTQNSNKTKNSNKRKNKLNQIISVTRWYSMSCAGAQCPRAATRSYWTSYASSYAKAKSIHNSLILNDLRRFLLVFGICQYILQPVKKKNKKNK